MSQTFWNICSFNELNVMSLIEVKGFNICQTEVISQMNYSLGYSTRF